jgi:chromosome segregation ATPase
VSLEDAIAKARAELEALKEREAEVAAASGVDSLVEQLTAENQALQEQRMKVREEIDRLEAAVTAARQRGSELELQLKGARARVQKLTAAVGRQR